MNMDISIINMISGMCAGALRSIMGWTESGESFNSKLMVITVVKTAIIGASMGYVLQHHPIATFFEVYFTDSITNKSYKIVRKKLRK